jgi:outer membrane protein W
MEIATGLLVAALLAPANQPPGVPAVRITAPLFSGTDQRRPPDRGQSQNAPRKHRFGIGTNITAGNRGAGGSFRYWFGDRVGMDVAARWYYGGGRTRPGGGSSTFQASPSVLVMLTESNPDRDIDVRPYVGGGVNYVYTSTPPYATNVSARGSGVAGQAFGGAEFTFKEARQVAISAEVGYYTLPASFVSAYYVAGWNYTLLFTYYLR